MHGVGLRYGRFVRGSESRDEEYRVHRCTTDEGAEPVPSFFREFLLDDVENDSTGTRLPALSRENAGVECSDRATNQSQPDAGEEDEAHCGVRSEYDDDRPVRRGE